jgi:phosphoglycerol transferase MdoB-like AlkP superfamily enzyme
MMELPVKLPKVIRFALSLMATLLLGMIAYRLFFFFHYRPANKPFSGSMMLMGLRYDLRIVAVIGLSVFILFSICKPFTFLKRQKIFIVLLVTVFFIFLIFYSGDFYYYDYLKQRLSAAVLNFAQDAAISVKMMWQTYPLVKIMVLIIVLIALFVKYIKQLFSKISADKTLVNRNPRIIFSVIFVLLTVIAIFGKVGQYPLRWSDAFSLSDDFKANAALNPFQSFFSTMSFKNVGYDIKKVKENYLLMADYLGVNEKNTETLNFNRSYSFAADTSVQPNVVVVICESFSAYKSSMFGNKLNPTPYFNEMCKNGIFFERCFTPAFGTARGVWATLTGVPDVQDTKTASRNPAAVDQHIIMNDFNGYNKFYFLGGSATWANIRGLLTNNIKGLKIYEEEDFKAKKVDVWGISDKNLFLEANKVFAGQTKPFISIIQTADNHRPYTIPSEDLTEFKKVEYPADTLKKHGFDDNAQLNAFRYTDFCFAKFIEASKKEKYFANTIFVFVGDHGLRGDAGTLFPQSFTKQGILAEHVPLLFYAPQLLQPKRVAEPASQMDIFPSVAFLAGRSFTNTALGTNLFDTTNKKSRYAFVADPDLRTIGVVSNDYYCVKNLNTNVVDFVSVINNDPVLVNAKTDSLKKIMEATTEAFYNTGKYLLLNNKKKVQ